MRAFVRFLDSLLRRCLGVYEFSDDPGCILRIQLTRAPHTLHLPEREVPQGAPVLGLHLWNEHLPLIPSEGATLAWAVRMRRQFGHSLYLVAREMQRDPRLANVQAVGALTGALIPGDASTGARVMQNFGFTVTPFHRRLGWVAEFWENLFSWWLILAYQPGGLRYHHLFRMARTQMWISAEEFLSRHGAAE